MGGYTMKKLYKLSILLLILLFPAFAFAGGGATAMMMGASGAVASGTETIGVETPGGTALATSAGYLILSAFFTAAHSGTFQTISMYFACSSASQDLKLGLYDGATASTAALVGYLEYANPGVVAAGWHDLDVSGQGWSAVAGHSYWIGYNTNDTAINYYYDESGANSGYALLQTYTNAWPDPYGAGSGGTKLRSLKATIAY